MFQFPRRALLAATLPSFALAAWLMAPAPTQAVSYHAVDLRIETLDETLYHDTVFVADSGCTVTDQNGTSHEVAGAAAVCALDQAAAADGFSYGLQEYPGFGLFLSSIDAHDGSDGNYWLYYVNDQSPSAGIADYDLADGDELLLAYGGLNPPLRLTLDKVHRRTGSLVRATVETYVQDFATGTGQYEPVENVPVNFGGVAVLTDAAGHAEFTPEDYGAVTVTAEATGFTRAATTVLRVYPAVDRFHSLSRERRRELAYAGVDYLLREMDESGVVGGSQAVTEWSAMAVSAVGTSNRTLFAAVEAYEPTAEHGASELARHIMALEAIGKDSRNHADHDYVARLKKTIVDGQFGSELYCNDDIFAVLALIAADEAYSSPELRDAVEFTYACFADDGGVGFAVGGAADIDTTAAWLGMAARLQGKKDQHGLEDLKEHRQAALAYLRRAQNPDGGWGYEPEAVSNASSTAWVLQALRARRHEARAMTTNNLNGFHFLESVQRESSGAMRYDLHGSDSLETLNTAYSVMILRGKPFPVNKPSRLKRD